MNNRRQTLTLSDVWTNLPHPVSLSCDRPTLKTSRRERRDILCDCVRRRKTTGRMQHSSHTSQACFVLNHKGTIAAGCFPSPQWAGSDTLPTHRTKTTFVTGGKKGCDGRMKDGDLALDHWAVVKVNIVRCDLGVFVGLVEEKTASKRW